MRSADEFLEWWLGTWLPSDAARECPLLPLPRPLMTDPRPFMVTREMSKEELREWQRLQNAQLEKLKFVYFYFFIINN